ncbi:glycosyltransferase family 4 protein [Sulfitobacter sp. HGT1]|uniref:glycosyltransferase family 4 protein n=1 Tax=Sulfitobacter sp. HGT1 TaxID=2735435 RepID=UPI00159447D8|nr:glycosyltransferase family 4 protein [Sulfitobacter sp. HGT1]
MKTIFAHDHRFIKAEDKVWSENQFESALWTRYLAHFDALTVVARHGTLPPGKTVEQLEKSSTLNVDFEFFPNLSNVMGLTLARPAAMRRMQALVADHDAVIARLPSEIGYLAIAAARAAGKPWAVEVVGCPWDGMWYHGGLAARLYAPAAWIRLRQALRHADNAIYVTRDFLQRRYPTRAQNSTVASNVVLKDLAPDILGARLARIATTPNRELRLGLIGTLRNRYKGIQTVLAALARTRAELPPLSLHILGGGDPAPWRQESERLGIADIVHFEGTLPAGDPVMHWLDEIDIYLQPSFQEGLPRALIEAMSRGCPVLASTAAGIPELLPEEDLIRPGDARALAALLLSRIADSHWMVDRAHHNWHEAHSYRTEVLDARRALFWEAFRSDAASRRRNR